MIVTHELSDPGPGKRDFDPEVARLQRELKAVGEFSGKLDGRPGPETTEAVKGFARWRNQQEPVPNPPLREDGHVDAYYGAWLNAWFHLTDVGRVVKDREDSLALKEQRIQQIHEELAKNPSPDREIELRTRLHQWLERKAEELRYDPFHGIRGYELAALLPHERFATDALAAIPSEGGPPTA